MTSADDFRGKCFLCDWVSEPYPTRDLAGHRSSWHVYMDHPDAWRALFGDQPPRDLDPRKASKD